MRLIFFLVLALAALTGSSVALAQSGSNLMQNAEALEQEELLEEFRQLEDDWAYAIRVEAYYRAVEVALEKLLVSRRSYGQTADETLDAVANYALALELSGQFAESAKIYELLLSISEGRKPRAEIFNSYGRVLGALGQDEDAEQVRNQAVLVLQNQIEFFEGWAAKRTPDDRLWINFMASFFLSFRKIDDAYAAAPLFERAITLSRATFGDGGSTIGLQQSYALLLTNYGRHLEEKARGLSAEQPSEARRLFEEATRQFELAAEQYAQLDHILVEISLHDKANFGYALWKVGRKKEAKPLYFEVEEKLIDHVFGRPKNTAQLQQIVQFYIESNELDKAVVLSEVLISNQTLWSNWQRAEGIASRAQFERETELRKSVARARIGALWAIGAGERLKEQELAKEVFRVFQLAGVDRTSLAMSNAAMVRTASNFGNDELVREQHRHERNWINLNSSLNDEIIRQFECPSERFCASDQKISEIWSNIEFSNERWRELVDVYNSEDTGVLELWYNKTTDIDDFRSYLASDEALVVIVPAELGTHSLVVTKDTIEWSRSDIDELDLARRSKSFREGLEIRASGGLPIFDFDLAFELYTELIEPVEPSLEDKAIVYFVAGGALSRIPMGTLLTSKLEEGTATGQKVDLTPQRATTFGEVRDIVDITNNPKDFLRAEWLADRYALVQLPSVQSLTYIRNFKVNEQAGDNKYEYVGFGDPVLFGHASVRDARSMTPNVVDAASLVYRERDSIIAPRMNPEALRMLSSLPGTREELEIVKKVMGVDQAELFLGDEMTETAIRNADLSKTRVLHLATHGLTSEESSQLGMMVEPGLVFTPPQGRSTDDDGYLSASEVLGLNLVNADLVILSACNTAAPSGKIGETGLSGLARAFFFAGAESMLVSHWPVFDSVAPLLTSQTLIRAKNGTPRAEAFQQAMQHVRKSFPHPAAWAPFVLVGEGR